MLFTLVSIIFYFAYALAGEEATHEPPSSKVHVLDYDTFDSFARRADLFIMEFYAPWCGHCQHVAPLYREAASRMADMDLPYKVKFAKMDDSDEYNRQLRAGAEDVFNFTSYPTMLVFKNDDIPVGNPEHWVKNYQGKQWQYYGGGRESAEDFIFYLTSVANGEDPFDNERKVRPGFYKKGGKHASDAVIDLEPDGATHFNKTVLEDPNNRVWIIEFYSDRCPFCNTLAPEIIKASKKVNEELPNEVVFGAVNSRVYHEIAEAHGITSYPWVASFYQGAKIEDMAGLGGWESVYNWAKAMHSQAWSSSPPENKWLLESPYSSLNGYEAPVKDTPPVKDDPPVEGDFPVEVDPPVEAAVDVNTAGETRKLESESSATPELKKEGGKSSSSDREDFERLAKLAIKLNMYKAKKVKKMRKQKGNAFRKAHKKLKKKMGPIMKLLNTKLIDLVDL